MVRRTADVLVAAAAAALCADIVTSSSSVYVRTPFALALLLILPGYAVVAALFVQLDTAARIVLSVGTSIAVAVLGGLALDLTPWGLQLRSWTVLLTAVTVVGAVVAGVRRKPATAGVPRLPRPRLGDVLIVALTGALVAGAVALARTPLAAKHVAGYTVLWIQPATPGHLRSVVVGVKSSELRSERYRLELRVGGRAAVTRVLELRPGQQWQAVFPTAAASSPAGATAEAGTTVSARLYRADDPRAVYRRVMLHLR